MTHPGFIGGMIGAFVGLLGGVFGTYCSYRNACSQKERRWILVYAGAWLVLIGGFISMVLFLFPLGATPWWATVGVFALFFPLLILSIRHLNRLRQEGLAGKGADRT
jgi:uncharacterized YccA/Bax inhibitor family protein